MEWVESLDIKILQLVCYLKELKNRFLRGQSVSGNENGAGYLPFLMGHPEMFMPRTQRIDGSFRYAIENGIDPRYLRI